MIREAKRALAARGPRSSDVLLGRAPGGQRAATLQVFIPVTTQGGRIPLGTDPAIIRAMIADLEHAAGWLENGSA